MTEALEDLQGIADAYTLATNPDASLDGIEDVVNGRDADGIRRPIAVIRPDYIALRGTILPGDAKIKLIEWLRDCDVWPERTPFGTLARGAWLGYDGLTCRSGKPLAAYAGRRVTGHSYGAGLAAIVAVSLQSKARLWAAPKWFFGEFRERFAKLGCEVYAVAGDIVPHLGYILEPSVQVLTHLLPPAGIVGIAECHELATYCAAYRAQLALKQAA